MPLALGTWPDFEIPQPLGYAVIGGLMVSGALTLYASLVIYRYMDWLGRRRARRAEQAQNAFAADLR